MNSKLRYPFNYYWRKFQEGKCPFCDEDIEYEFGGDIIYCNQYNGYITAYQDEAVIGSEGPCRICSTMREMYVTETEGSGFLCENCHHGISFDELKMFQELFHLHDEEKCVHCTWHSKKSSHNPIEKPGS